MFVSKITKSLNRRLNYIIEFEARLQQDGMDVFTVTEASKAYGIRKELMQAILSLAVRYDFLFEHLETYTNGPYTGQRKVYRLKNKDAKNEKRDSDSAVRDFS